MKYLVLFLIFIAACVPSAQITIPDDYQQYADQCGESRCCLESVREMAKDNAPPVVTSKQNTQCPDEFEAKSINCAGSYIWCTPSELTY